MKYVKPPLTFEQQADLLLRRGMTGDRKVIIDRLQVVNYYRLSGYWHPFRNPDDSFKTGTSFETVWRRYVFDRRLRLQVMDAIERIEVAVRSQLAYHHAHHHGGPFAYADDPKTLRQIDPSRRRRLMDQLADVTKYSKELFVQHFLTKYGSDHAFMPVWMAIELMTFGDMLTFYRGCSPVIRQNVAKSIGIHDIVLDSWLLAINTIRNTCAHHGRLWNKVLGTKPKIPDKAPEWRMPVSVVNNRMFGILTICNYCLRRLAPQSHWSERLRNLLDEFPDVPKANMGFPGNWRECPIWGNTP